VVAPAPAPVEEGEAPPLEEAVEELGGVSELSATAGGPLPPLVATCLREVVVTLPPDELPEGAEPPEEEPPVKENRSLAKVASDGGRRVTLSLTREKDEAELEKEAAEPAEGEEPYVPKATAWELGSFSSVSGELLMRGIVLPAEVHPTAWTLLITESTPPVDPISLPPFLQTRISLAVAPVPGSEPEPEPEPEDPKKKKK